MQRKVLPFILLLLLTGFSSSAYAQASVVASLDKTAGTLEDYFRLSLSVRGSVSGSPEIPPIEGLSIESAGTSQQIQVINGEVSRNKEYTFVIRPKRVGEFTIPPILMKAGGKLLASEALTFRVAEVGKKERQAANRKIFLTAEVSQDEAFVGEQILYQLSFYRRISTTGAQLDKPSFEGFTIEELGKQRDSERVLNGERFQVTDLQFALFPVQAGEVKIQPARIAYEAIQQDPNDPFARFGFFSSGRRVEGQVLSPVLRVQVLPLPSEGKPANFTGLVGQFELTANLPKQTLSVGDSLTLTIRLQGKGNVRQIPDLNFSEGSGFEEDFKIYDDKPVLKITPTDQGLVGEKTLKKALVPRHPGDLRVPSLSLAFFDPQRRQYVQLATQSYSVHVLPGQEGESVVMKGEGLPRQKGIEVLGEDLMPLHTKVKDWNGERMSNTARLAYAGGALTPPLLFLIGWLIQHRRKSQGSNEKLIRSKRALPHALHALKQLSKQADLDSKQFHSELRQLTRQYLGDRLSLAGQALTAKEASELAKKHGTTELRARELEQLLQHCEEAEFGTNRAGVDALEKERLIRESASLMKFLDKSMKGVA